MGPTWLMAGPQASAGFMSALAAGIEVDRVRRLIRRHRLMPPEPATAAESGPGRFVSPSAASKSLR